MFVLPQIRMKLAVLETQNVDPQATHTNWISFHFPWGKEKI
jgi:hypothetical protein